MTKRGIVLLLILTGVIAFGALIQDYRFDALIATERASGRILDQEINATIETVLTLPAAQSAYFADGQGPAEWSSRVNRLEDEISSAIARRRSNASDAQAVTVYDAAAEALARLKRLDTEIRNSISQNDQLHAVDLVYTDSPAAGQKIIEALRAGSERDRAAIDAGVTRLTNLRLAMNGVALLFAVAIAAFFGNHISRVGVKAPLTMAQMIRDLPPAVKPASAATPAPSPAVAAAAPPPPLAPSAPAPVARSTNLPAAAELCVDLSLVLDSSAMPALLDRMATLLDARGIVIWAVDSDGARLRPALSQGYEDRILKKLRPLQIDSDNVTSLAFRTLLAQTVNGATVSDPAAIAIPLMTGSGCVGVMSAELRQNRPHADIVPMARIVGAQFSTLVAMPEETPRRTAQA